MMSDNTILDLYELSRNMNWLCAYFEIWCWLCAYFEIWWLCVQTLASALWFFYSTL